MTPQRQASIARSACAAILLAELACGHRPLDARASTSAAGEPPAPPSLAATTLEATTRRVTILMSATTAEALLDSGAALYGAKAVESTDRAGLPLVWFRAPRLSRRTTVTWQREYQAYTASEDHAPSVSIAASAAYDIAPGQVLDVEHAAGTGTVRLGAQPEAIAIYNETRTPFWCGLAQRLGDGSAPITAFPLYGNQQQVMIPIDRVLLVFATAPLPPGTPLRISPGLGLIVDLFDARDRTVTYDLNGGWSWDLQPWARTVAPGADLAPWLIVPP